MSAVGIDWIRRCLTPERRVVLAFWMLVVTLVCWPATHVLILITKPPELASWVGHLLLAISWGAMAYTALDFLATNDVREEQES